MAPGIHAGYPDWYKLYGSMAFGQEYDPTIASCDDRNQMQQQHKSPRVRDLDQDSVCGHSSRTDIFLGLGTQLAIHISLFPTTLTSLNPILSSDHKSLCLSLSSTSTTCTFSPQWCQTVQCQNFGWVTSSTWLNITHRGHKGCHTVVAFPLFHAWT